MDTLLQGTERAQAIAELDGWIDMVDGADGNEPRDAIRKYYEFKSFNAAFGFMTRAAMKRGLKGVVIDGAIRDAAEIRELGFPCYARANVPAGPHKGFGGIIDGPISCAGCPVKPGDLVVGDDDGIAVVPLEWAEDMLAASKEKLRQEEETLKQIAEGKTTAELLGIGEPEIISE